MENSSHFPTVERTQDPKSSVIGVPTHKAKILSSKIGFKMHSFLVYRVALSSYSDET